MIAHQIFLQIDVHFKNKAMNLQNYLYFSKVVENNKIKCLILIGHFGKANKPGLRFNSAKFWFDFLLINRNFSAYANGLVQGHQNVLKK